MTASGVPGPNISGQSAPLPDAVLTTLANREFDIETSGRTLLLEEARKSDYFLLGELHGDNEIPRLIHDLWPSMWKDGYRHVAAEISPWTANRLQAAPDPKKPRIQSLWTRQQADEVRAFAATGANVLWGCDMEEFHPEELIRQWSALNPENPVLRQMTDLVRDGYQRSMAEKLLTLAKAIRTDRDMRVNDISLRDNILATLEIDKNRADPASKMEAQNDRERLMKTQFVEHLRTRSGFILPSKVLLRFGRNHLHRGYDARGISTLGNFVVEFALSRGQSVFNVGAFGAGGHAALMGETFSADERQDEPAFAFLAEKARFPATVYDLRPLRPLLHAIAPEKRSALEINLIYWVDAYDALICYKTVTPSPN